MTLTIQGLGPLAADSAYPGTPGSTALPKAAPTAPSGAGDKAAANSPAITGAPRSHLDPIHRTAAASPKTAKSTATSSSMPQAQMVYVYDEHLHKTVVKTLNIITQKVPSDQPTPAKGTQKPQAPASPEIGKHVDTTA